MNSFLRNVGFYLLVICIAVTAYDYFSVKPKPVEEMSYTQFLQQVESGNIAKVVVVQNTIQATKKDGKEFTTIAPDEPVNDEGLIGKLQKSGVEIFAQNPKEPPWWMTLLSTLLPIALLVGFWYFMINQAQGGGGKVFSFGKSRAKLMGGEKGKVKFDDVAGADEAKEDLAEVVEFLDRQAQAKHFLPKPSPVKRAWRSSQSAARISSKCSSASVPQEFVTSSRRQRKIPRA